MLRFRFLKGLMISVAVVMMTACGGGGDNPVLNPEVAKIVNWAENGGTAPIAEDYEAAGVDLNGHSANEINRYIQQYYAEHGSSGVFDSDAELNRIAEDLGVTIVDTDGDGIYDAFDPTPGGDAHAPTVSINQTGGTIFTTETVSLSATASDPDGDSLTYVWSLDTKPEGSQSEMQTPMSLNSSFVPDVAGEYVVQFYAFDGTNFSSKKSVTFLAVVRGECVDLDWKIIDENTVLDQPCYQTKHIRVEEGAILTINPGTTIIFKKDTYNQLEIKGTLKAIGTEDKVITFTSEDKTDGAWVGILIESTTENEIEHVVVEYANRGIQMGGSTAGGQQLSLKNSLIAHSKKYGLWTGHGIDLDMENVTFSKNDTPVYIYANRLPMINDTNIYVGNTHNYVKVDADPNSDKVTDSNQTWHRISVPYHFIDYGPMVEYNATLTIEPGVEIEFTESNHFIVEGTLNAVGTEANPILFTAAQELIDANKTWKGLLLRENTYYNQAQDHKLQHFTLEYAQKGLNFKGNEHTSISILDTTFQHNSSAGFTLEGSDVNLVFDRVRSTQNGSPGDVPSYMLSVLDDTSNFTGNTIDLLYARGDVSEDQTWNKQTVPMFPVSIFVDEDATLTINKGSTVAISSPHGISVWTGGTLIANGTAAEPITFIGIAPSLTDYEASRWYGFGIFGSMEMSHAIIKRAGGYYDTHEAGTEGAIVVYNGASATISDSSIVDSGKHAIYVECNTNFSQSGNTFLNSGDIDIKYQENCE